MFNSVHTQNVYLHAEEIFKYIKKIIISLIYLTEESKSPKKRKKCIKRYTNFKIHHNSFTVVQVLQSQSIILEHLAVKSEILHKTKKQNIIPKQVKRKLSKNPQ